MAEAGGTNNVRAGRLAGSPVAPRCPHHTQVCVMTPVTPTRQYTYSVTLPLLES